MRLPFLLATVVLLALPSHAAEDPVAVRKALMQSVGASAAVSSGLMKEEIPYAPALGKAAIAAIAATAAAYGDYFPEGTENDPRSAAAPTVWSDRAGFEAEIAKLQAAIGAASEGAGREGFAELADFSAAIQPVLGTCRACHETYQVRR